MTIDMNTDGAVMDSGAKQRELGIAAFEEYKAATTSVWKEELESLEKRSEEIREQFRKIKDRIAELKTKTEIDGDGMGYAVQIAEMIPGATKELLITILEKKFGEIPADSKSNGKSVRPSATEGESESQVLIKSPMNKDSIVEAISRWGRPISMRELVDSHRHPASKPSIHNMINQLVEEGKVVKLGENRDRTYGLTE